MMGPLGADVAALIAAARAAQHALADPARRPANDRERAALAADLRRAANCATNTAMPRAVEDLTAAARQAAHLLTEQSSYAQRSQTERTLDRCIHLAAIYGRRTLLED
ncbi:MAG: hypothetical protein QM809_01115 [Gordonia sp. (in: high G+C Gram-positive bacteria)]|uniref:hypothetical protein n=1 Tax=Gordonia sp. (in: high G+C Gram-positive bacteria) TaxID=84139 RepID=UPI0039E6A495